jgi:hypothetical protein
MGRTVYVVLEPVYPQNVGREGEIGAGSFVRAESVASIRGRVLLGDDAYAQTGKREAVLVIPYPGGGELWLRHADLQGLFEAAATGGRGALSGVPLHLSPAGDPMFPPRRFGSGAVPFKESATPDPRLLAGDWRDGHEAKG